jgi:hypothetical protein
MTHSNCDVCNSLINGGFWCHYKIPGMEESCMCKLCYDMIPKHIPNRQHVRYVTRLVKGKP